MASPDRPGSEFLGGAELYPDTAEPVRTPSVIENAAPWQTEQEFDEYLQGQMNGAEQQTKSVLDGPVDPLAQAAAIETTKTATIKANEEWLDSRKRKLAADADAKYGVQVPAREGDTWTNELFRSTVRGLAAVPMGLAGTTKMVADSLEMEGNPNDPNDPYIALAKALRGNVADPAQKLGETAQRSTPAARMDDFTKIHTDSISGFAKDAADYIAYGLGQAAGTGGPMIAGGMTLGIPGLIGASATINMGDLYHSLETEGITDPKIKQELTLGIGSVIAGLDALVPADILTVDAKRGVAKYLAKSWARRVATGVGKTGLEELITEGIQESLSVIAEADARGRTVGDDDTTTRIWDSLGASKGRIANAAALGFIGGVAMGGPTAVLEAGHPNAKTDAAPAASTPADGTSAPEPAPTTPPVDAEAIKQQIDEAGIALDPSERETFAAALEGLDPALTSTLLAGAAQMDSPVRDALARAAGTLQFSGNEREAANEFRQAMGIPDLLGAAQKIDEVIDAAEQDLPALLADVQDLMEGKGLDFEVSDADMQAIAQFVEQGDEVATAFDKVFASVAQDEQAVAEPEEFDVGQLPSIEQGLAAGEGRQAELSAAAQAALGEAEQALSIGDSVAAEAAHSRRRELEGQVEAERASGAELATKREATKAAAADNLTSLGSTTLAQKPSRKQAEAVTPQETERPSVESEGYPAGFLDHVKAGNSLSVKSRAELALSLGLGQKQMAELLDRATKDGWLRKDGRGVYRPGEKVIEARGLPTKSKKKKEAQQKAIAALDAVEQAVAEVGHMLPPGTEVKAFDDTEQLPDDLATEASRAMSQGYGIDAVTDKATGDIYLAAYAADPTSRLVHEGVHAMVLRGLMTLQEVKVIARKVSGMANVFNREAYAEVYRGRKDIENQLDEEAAAHAIEARRNGVDLGTEVNTILDRVLAFFERLGNALRGLGFQSAEDVMQAFLSGGMARRVGDKVVADSGAMFALSLPERKIDALGYYSKLDEVLASFRPSDTVTSATLKQRGIKDAELEARGVASLLAGKGAKVSDLMAAVQPVEIRENVYVSEDEDEIGRRVAKWTDYSLDPSNPTYRETVLYAPAVETNREWTALSKRIAEIGEEQYTLGREFAGAREARQAELDARGNDLAEEQMRLGDARRDLENEINAGTFSSGHWSEPNVIAHIRTGLYQNDQGKPTMLLDELQSDWGQKIRDGGVRDEAKIKSLQDQQRAAQKQKEDFVDKVDAFLFEHKTNGHEFGGRKAALMQVRDNRVGLPTPDDRAQAAAFIGIMDATAAEEQRIRAELYNAENGAPGNPLVNSSDTWMQIGLRRFLKMAVEAGSEGVAVTPGSVQNERFGLAKHVDALSYSPQSGNLLMRPPEGGPNSWRYVAEGIAPDKVKDYVGKEIADKLLATELTPDDGGDVGVKSSHLIENLGDLEIGGDGMKFAYDNMYPKMLLKELQRLDPGSVYGKTKFDASNMDQETADKYGYNKVDGKALLDVDFHYFPLSDLAKQRINEGLPMFGQVDQAKGNPVKDAASDAVQSAAPPVKRSDAMFALSFLDSEAERLTKDVARFEAKQWEAGRNAEEISKAIEARYGFSVDPDDLAMGYVWWKVEGETDGRSLSEFISVPAIDDLIGGDSVSDAMDVDARPARSAGLSDFIAFAGQTLNPSSLSAEDKVSILAKGKAGQSAVEIAKAMSVDRYVSILDVANVLNAQTQSPKKKEKSKSSSGFLYLRRGTWHIGDGFGKSTQINLGIPEDNRADAETLLQAYKQAKTTGGKGFITPNLTGPKPPRLLYKKGKVNKWIVKYDGKETSTGAGLNDTAKAQAFLETFTENLPKAPSLKVIRGTWHINDNGQLNDTGIAEPNREEAEQALEKYQSGVNSGAMFAISPQDKLGFTSKLDEVLAQFRPTDTVTAATLQQRGVKEAELELRGVAGKAKARIQEGLPLLGNPTVESKPKSSAMFAISINPQEWMNEYLGRNQAATLSEAVAQPGGSNVSGEPGQGQAGDVSQSSPEESPGLGGASLFDVRGAVGKFARGRASPRGLKRLSYYYYTLQSTGLPSASVDDEVRGKFMRGTSHWWAKTEVTQDTDGKYTLHIRVRKNKRRRNVATDVVRSIETHLGSELKPAGQITPTEYKFWAKLKPELVEDYSRIGANHFSPEALEELRLVNDTILEYSKNARERSAARKDRDLIYAALEKITKKKGSDGDSGAMFAISQIPEDIEAWLETITGEQDGLRVREREGDDRQGGEAESGSTATSSRAGAGQADLSRIFGLGRGTGPAAARNDGPAPEGRPFTLQDPVFKGYKGQITEGEPTSLGEKQQVWQLWNGKGKTVARVDLIQRTAKNDSTLNGNYWEVAGVKVHANERGRGLANAVYNRIEESIGQALRPSAILTEGGYKLWQKRNPEAVKYHRPYMNGWFSPKRLLRFKLSNDEAAQAAENMDDLQKALDTNQRLNAVLSSIPEEAFNPDISGAMFAIDPNSKKEKENQSSHTPNLPMDKDSRLERAREMGFDTETVLYHGTGKVVYGGFDLGRSGDRDAGVLGRGVYLTSSSNLASAYAAYAPGDNKSVIPVYARLANPFLVTQKTDYTPGESFVSKMRHLLERYQEAHPEDDLKTHMLDNAMADFEHGDDAAKSVAQAVSDMLQGMGYDGVIYTWPGQDAEYAIFNPNNIRSINAAFDPLRDGKPDLMFAATPTVPGIPQPAAPTQALTGISRIVAMLGDAVGLPIRVGRVSRVPGVKATVSYADSGVGRISNVDDIQQASDVVADHLERVLGEELSNLRAANQGELIGMAREIGQEDVSFGFRQFMYRYVTSYLGRYAQGKAPQFYDGFEDLLGKVAPNMLADIQEVQEAYAKYAQAEPSERLKTDIVRPIPKVGYVATATQRAEAQNQVAQLQAGDKGQKLGFIYSLGRIFTSDFYRNFVARNFAGHQFQRYALDLHEDNTAMEGVEPHVRIQSRMQEKGLDVDQLATAIHEPLDVVQQIVDGSRKPTRDIMDKLQGPLGMTRAWIATGRDRITLPRGLDLFAKMKSAGNVRSWVENVFNYGFDSRFHNPDGTTAKLGPGYLEVMAAVMNTGSGTYAYDDEMLADFDAFLIARRAALTLYPKYRQGLIPHQPVRESEAAVRKVYADMLAKHPHFEQAVQMWDEFHQSWLMYAKEWGLISDEQYENYMLDQNYAPFSREMADLQIEAGKAGAQGRAPTGQLLKRLQGSDRNILSPTAVTMARIQTLVQRAYQQSFSEVLENLHDIAGPGIGIVMEKVPATDMKVQQINAIEAVRKAVQAAGLEMDDVQVLMDSLADIAGDPESLKLNMFTQRPIQAKPGEILIPYRKGGELHFMALYSTKTEPHLAEDIFTAYAMAGGAPNQEVWMKLLQNLAQVRRAQITTWPGFIARNLMLDPIVHWGLFRWIKFPGQSHIEGIRSWKAGDEYYQAYTSQMGGAGIMGGQLHALAREGISDQSVRKLVGQKVGAWENLRSFWDKLGQYSEMSEMFGRVGLFKMAAERAMKQQQALGLPVDKIAALQEAGYAATDVMNYAEFGKIMQLFRTISPFFGAGIVGTDKGIRQATGYSQRGFAIKRYQEAWSRLGDREQAWDSLSENEREAIRDAAATTFKSLMVFGALDMLLWALFHDDDDWKDVPDEVHNTHWVVPIGGVVHLINRDWDEPGFLKDTMIRIPKPFELGVPGNIARLSMDAYVREQGGLKTADRVVSSALQSLMPPMSMPFLEEYAALGQNRNPMSDRPLVPNYLATRDPEDQASPYTSSIGKAVGEATLTSPLAVDFAIKTALGPWGRDLMNLTDRLDPNKPSADLTSFPLPGLSRFVTAQGKGSVSLDEYYETMNPPMQMNANHLARLLGQDITAYNPAKANYHAAFDRGRLDVAREELDKMNLNERIYSMLSENWKGSDDTAISSPTAHKRLHPLVRFEAEKTVLLEAARDITSNDLFKEKSRIEKKYKPGAVPAIDLNSGERRDVLKILKAVQIAEASNALALIGAKGHTNDRPVPIEPMMMELKAASPKAYDEINRRLEKAHVLPFEAIQKTWPDVYRIMSDPSMPDKVTRTEMPMVKPILMGVYGQADREARALKKQREAVK